MTWVETQVPCMLYCGDDLCNCTARYYYEELEEWLTQDKKELAEKKAYEAFCVRAPGYVLTGCQVVDPAKSRVTYISPESVTVSALK